MSLILQFYNRKIELLKFEPQANEIKEYIDSVKREAEEIDSREKALEIFLEARN